MPPSDLIRCVNGAADGTITLPRHRRATVRQPGIAGPRQYESVRAAAVESGEGAPFGEQQAACRGTHGSRGVAYNSLSSTGVRT